MFTLKYVNCELFNLRLWNISYGLINLFFSPLAELARSLKRNQETTAK